MVLALANSVFAIPLKIPPTEPTHVLKMGPPLIFPTFWLLGPFP